MKNIHVHVTVVLLASRANVIASYVTSKLMDGCSSRHTSQSYIARSVNMHGYLMMLNRILA